MNKEPTEEQKNKVWKWCGLKYESYNTLAFPHQGGAWVDSLGNSVDSENPFELPPIDLNNLFKYAVPRIQNLRWVKISFAGNCELRIGYKAVFNQPVKSDIDPAVALFYVCEEVINAK